MADCSPPPPPPPSPSPSPVPSPPTSSAPPSISSSPHHLLSHLSYDGLLLHLSRLQRSAGLLHRTLGRRIAANPALDDLRRCPLHFLDCTAHRHSVHLHCYDAFTTLHRLCVRRTPEHLRGWLQVGLYVASEAEKENDCPPVFVQPLPLHLHRASLRQLLDHCLPSPPPLPSAPCLPPAHPIILTCYGEVEVWLHLPFPSHPTLVRTPNCRVLPHLPLQSQCLPSLARAVRARHLHLPDALTWRWSRHPLTATRGPDLTKATALQPDWPVSRCDFHLPDCALVAEATLLPGAEAGGEGGTQGLRLEVQRLGGDHLLLTIDGRDTVAALKGHLQSAYGLPLGAQQLWVRQGLLEDEREVGSYLQPGCQVLTLLLGSGPAVLVTGGDGYRPVHFYREEAVEAVKALVGWKGLGRREVQGMAVEEMGDWLEEWGGRVGRVWAEVQGMGVKGVSATGRVWVGEEDEVRDWMDRWTQGHGGAREREEVEVEGEEEAARVWERAGLQAAGGMAGAWADATLPVVEVIELEGGEGEGGRMRGKRVRRERAVSAPVGRMGRERERRRRGGGLAGGVVEVVDLVDAEDKNRAPRSTEAVVVLS